MPKVAIDLRDSRLEVHVQCVYGSGVGSVYVLNLWQIPNVEADQCPIAECVGSFICEEAQIIEMQERIAEVRGWRADNDTRMREMFPDLFPKEIGDADKE